MAITHYVCTGGCLTVKYSPGKCIVVGCFRHQTHCLNVNAKMINTVIYYTEMTQLISPDPIPTKAIPKQSRKRKKI